MILNRRMMLMMKGLSKIRYAQTAAYAIVSTNTCNPTQVKLLRYNSLLYHQYIGNCLRSTNMYQHTYHSILHELPTLFSTLSFPLFSFV